VPARALMVRLGLISRTLGECHPGHSEAEEKRKAE
jgi:hypothetical protein